MPSQIDFASGTVLSSVNIPLEGIPLREELGKRLGVPVYVDNDANCAALAEAQLVPDAPAQHLVMLTLGTGVGGGIVIDGSIERGHTGLGAELGHVIVDGREALSSHRGGLPPARLAGAQVQRHRARAGRHSGREGQSRRRARADPRRARGA